MLKYFHFIIFQSLESTCNPVINKPKPKPKEEPPKEEKKDTGNGENIEDGKKDQAKPAAGDAKKEQTNGPADMDVD